MSLPSWMQTTRASAAALLVLITVQSAVRAETPGFDAAPDLPPRAEVERILANRAEVKAAQAELEAEQARRRRLEVGIYEPVVRAGTQQRRVSDVPARWTEWSLGLERALRVGDKARLDASLGEQGVRLARSMVGEARHEAARQLLDAWFSALREAEIARAWQAQRSVLDAQRDALTRRLRAGDASRLELQQVEAAWQQVEAQRVLAEGRAAQSTAEFARRYGFAPPDGLAVAGIAPIETEAAPWIARVLEASHELAAARDASALARLQAERADAERRPDPTVGVHLGSERGGVERILGLAVSVPLPGAARQATVEVVTAQARAAAAREAAVRRRIEVEVEGGVRRVVSAREGWERLTDAADRLEQAATLTGRAWTLGEGSLGDWLAARRVAAEARIAERSARVDAAQFRYRLLLDAHLLWDLDVD